MEYMMVVAPALPEVLRPTVTVEMYQPFAPAVPDNVAETCKGLGGGTMTLCATTGLEEAENVESPTKRAWTYSVWTVLPRKAIFPENPPLASVGGNWPI
jgi:hypothetical protein